MDEFQLRTCQSESLGSVNQLFSSLLSTILTAQCLLSPTSMWPDNYGSKISKDGSIGRQLTFLSSYMQSIYKVFLFLMRRYI